MMYLCIGVLAVISVVLCLSYIHERGKNRFQILMLLLASEETGSDSPVEICYGRDPEALQKELETLAKQGYIEKYSVPTPEDMPPKTFYRLTRDGYRFAMRWRSEKRRRD